MGGAARRRPHQAALASGSRTSSAPGDHTIVQATETYLDAASTTPLHPDARKALEQAVDAYGDPARLYGRARRARLLLDQSRERVAAALGARADEVVFTSGGTEAANLAVAGMARGARRRRHLVVSAVEHTAVLAPARLLEPQGFEVTEVGVDHYGRVDPAELAAAVRDDTLLVCLQHANHEVGTVQPVREAAEAASAHKCYGPPGVGCLVVRGSTRLKPILLGDERERRRRAGMENLPGVAAMAAALEARSVEGPAESPRLERLAERLRAGLGAIPDLVVHGHPSQRLPHLVAFSVLYVEGEALLLLDGEGIAVHSGSSCTADTQEPSHVLAAMGAITHGSVRASFLADETEADVDRLLGVLPGAIEDLREMAELDSQALDRAGRSGEPR